MKVALVHDALVNRGGAERVFQILCEMFPDATVYTTVYFPDRTFPYFKSRRVVTTPLQKVVRSEEQLKILFPLANRFMERLPIRDEEMILSSSTYAAKYISAKGIPHVSYCYTPFRLLWSPSSYLGSLNHAVQTAMVLPSLPLLRKWDYSAAQRVTKFVAMTKETHDRISKCYKRPSEIVPPPIDIRKFSVVSDPGEYFLVVSRLEPYKRVDIAVRAFNELGLPLTIVGDGSLRNRLKALAKKNIEFLGLVSDSELAHMYHGCRAVIFPQREDYGLVPLEANASARPVICYGAGGVNDTMVPYSENNKETATALFFNEQTVNSLKHAVLRFGDLHFERAALLRNARCFDKETFKQKIYNILQAC